MRFGLQIETYRSDDRNEVDSFTKMQAVARVAEEVGFESIWYEDHLSLIDDDRPDEPWPQLECLTTLAALCVSTDRVRIGSLVAGVPYRNPALIAKTFTTLDIISGGRVIAGVGAGWHRKEAAAYGYGDLDDDGRRMDALEDAVRILDAMMRTSPATFQGRRHGIDAARNDPQPVQRPRPPILVGGNGERRTLRIVAELADMCNVFGSPDEVRHRFDVLRRHCDSVGRPYADVTRTINYWALIADDAGERADRERRFPRASSVDTMDDTIEVLRAYEAVGTQVVIVKILDAADIAPVRRFAELVFPAFVKRA